MELASRLATFEEFRIDAEFRDDRTLQCVRTSKSGPRTWQTWKRARSLGGGHFGKVWQERLEAANGDWQYRAIKVCPQEQMNNASVDYKRELSALAAFSASKYAGFFVSFYGWWKDSKNVFVAMEYISRGDLSSYVSDGLEEDEAKEIADNLLSGLSAMHHEGFAHRDIKPQNILVVQKRPEYQRWWVKIGDFGISKRILEDSGSSLHTTIGTRPYCAPEVLGYLQQYEQSSIYSSKVDMWSLGCVLFNIGTRGHLAFSESNLVRYVDGRLPFNHTARTIHFSTDGVSLINWLLQPDPERRLSAIEALQHPWLSPEGQSSNPSISSMGTPPKRQYTKPSEESSVDHQNYNSFLQSTLSSQSSNHFNIGPNSIEPHVSSASSESSNITTFQHPQSPPSESVDKYHRRLEDKVHPVQVSKAREDNKDTVKEIPVENERASSPSLISHQGSQDKHTIADGITRPGKKIDRTTEKTASTNTEQASRATQPTINISHVREESGYSPRQASNPQPKKTTRDVAEVRAKKGERQGVLPSVDSSTTRPVLLKPVQKVVAQGSQNALNAGLLKISNLNFRPRAFVTGGHTPDFPPPTNLEDLQQLYFFNGNLVLDIPIAPFFLAKVPHAKAPERDEFTHMRYSVSDCHPMELGDNRFTFRPFLFAKPRTTEILVELKLESETGAMVAAHLRSILDSIHYMSNIFGDRYWKKIVFLIVGSMGSIHPSVYALLGTLGVYCTPYKTFYEREDAPKKPYFANIYEYSSQIYVSVNDGMVEVFAKSNPCQLMFVEIVDNKRSSVEETLLGIAAILKPSTRISMPFGLSIVENSLSLYWMQFSMSRSKAEISPTTSDSPSRVPFVKGEHFFVQTYDDDERDREYLRNISDVDERNRHRDGDDGENSQSFLRMMKKWKSISIWN